MPNNNTAPTWDETEEVSVPSFEETTPIEEKPQEQPLTYMQQGLRNRGLIKDDVQPATTGELKTDVTGSETMKALKSSAARAFGGILGLPSFIEDQIGAFVVKPIMKGIGYTDEEAQAHVDVMKNAPILGTVLTPAMSAASQQQVNKYASSIESTMKKYDEGIIGSISNGKYADAGAQLWKGTVESLPYLAMTAATAGTGTPAVLSTIGATAAAQRYGELQDPQSEDGKKLSETGKFLNSWAYGGMEAAGELVTAGLLNTAKKAVGQIGEEAAQELGKGFTKQILKDFALEGSSEGATELGQQVTDYISGLRDNIDLKAVGDAALVGGVAGAGIGGTTATANKAAQVIAGRKVASDADVETVNKNNAQIVDLMAEKEKAPTEDVAAVIDDQIKTVVEENNNIISGNIETASKLTPEEVVRIKDITDAVDSYDARIANPTPEDNVDLLTKIKEKLVSEKQAIVEEAKSRTKTQPITEEIKPTEAISAPVEARSAEEAPIISQEKKEPSMAQNIEEELPFETPISSLENTIVSYDGVKGRLTKEDNGYFVTDENGERYFVERGESGLSPEELGVYKENELPTYNPEDSSIDYLGNKYTYESANTDKNGDTVSINVIDESGKKKTIRNKFVVEEVEYQKALSEMEQSDGLNAITEQNITDAAKELNIKTHEEAGIAKTVEPIQQERPIEAPKKAPTKPKQVTQQKQPAVVGKQIQVEQQKQLENGKEIRDDETQRQRRQERLLRVQEIDNELGDVWSNLADIVGAKISLTGEQRAKIMPVVSQLAKLYTEKYALKGMDLVDQIIEHLTSKGIKVDEETTNQITQEYARESRKGTDEVSQQAQGVVEGEKRPLRVRDNEQTRLNERQQKDRKVVGETTEDSRLGVRWAWGKSFSPEAQEKYKAEGLYSYKPERQSDVEFTAKSIVENNTEKQSLRILKDTNVSRRVRTAIGALLVEQMDSRVEQLSQQGNTKEANTVVDDIVDVMEYLQKEVATESGRDISFLGSNFIVQRLGGYALARIAQKAMSKSRAKEISRKSYQNVRNAAQKELESGYNEAVEETIKKVVQPKQQKQVDPKVAEVRKKRDSLIEQWKKARQNPSNLYSSVIPGLTQVDIEYGGRIALTYIEEGVYRTEDLIKKLKNTFKRVGLEIDDDQAGQLIPEKVGEKPIEEYQNEQDLQKATEDLARRIFGDVIEKKAKQDDPLKKMVDTLFSKFKDTQLERQKGVKPDLLTKLSMAIQNASEYKDVWTEAKDEAITKIQSDGKLSDSQKQAAIDKIETAYKNATEFTFSDDLIKRIIKKELSTKKIDLADVIRDHFDKRNVVKEDLKKSIAEKTGISSEEANVLSKSINRVFDTLIADKSAAIIKKYVDKGKKKRTRKQQKGADEIIQLANTGAFENEKFINAFADAWGVPNLDAEDIKYIVDQTKIIQQIKGEAMKYEEKQKLLAHIANLEGIDWGELVDGIWYANVLSGAGTQLKNFLDANTAAIVEPLLISGSSQFKRARYRKALSRTATGRAWQNLRHTWKTGKHPFDLGSETPKLAERILAAKDPMVKNKMTWGAIQAAAKYQDMVFNLMMSNDAFAGTLAYESILDAIVTEAAYSEAKGSSGSKLTKEQKDALNRKIDEMLRVTPEDQRLINEQLDRESEEYKQVQAKKGEPQTGYSEEQRNVRFYEIMDSLRPLDFVEEARRISLEAVGNIQPYGTLGFMIDRLASGLTKIGMELHKPMIIKSGNKFKIAYSPTETFKLRPFQKVIPFTRIITNIATRNLNWNIATAAFRLATGKYGGALDLTGDFGKRYVRELTKEEKRIIKRKIVLTATIASVAYALTGGDDPEDSFIRITGNGTGDFQKNKLLTQAGWKPWSIIIGDKAISYQYLYPLNMILSPIGYARDQQIYNKSDRTFASLYGEGLGYSLGQVLFSTPMSGISTAFQTLGDLTYKGTDQFVKGLTKLGTSIGGGFIAPRVMDDVDKAIGMLADRSDVEGVTFMEKLADKIPFVGRNFAGKVEALDIFGDSVPLPSPTSSVYTLQNHFKNKELSKWLIEDIGYYRPVPEYGQITFMVQEKDGSINRSRKLVKGNNEDEAFFTEYNRTVGRYFKERVLEIKDRGLEKEETKDELERAWQRSVDKAKRYMFLLSKDKPLNTTQLK